MKSKSKLLFLSLFSGLTHAADNPNVLIVYTDEHNFRTLESYLPLMGEAQRHPWGNNVPLTTPNIKYLSDNGVVMNNCYVSTPVSTPSRASLMTGLYPQKTNCTVNDVALNTSLKTLPQLFAENGYATGYAGKWHLSGDPKPGWSPTPNYGWNSNKYMMNRGHYKSIKDNPNDGDPILGASESTLDPGFNTMSDYITGKAQDFINASNGNPFIYLVSFPDPHGPNVAAEAYYNLYKDFTFLKPPTAGKNMNLYPGWASGNVNLTQDDYRNYWGMVKCIDDNVGKLINTLKDNNILDKTILIFTSDHGDMCGEHGRVDKSIPLDASMKVPFIVFAPGILPPKMVVNEAVSNIDIFPTLAELCGLNNMPAVDGVSIVPLMRGDSNAVGRNCVFSRSTGSNTGWLSVTTDRYKLVHTSVTGDEAWLIDKQIDPDELINYYNNAAYTEIKKNLTEKLIRYCEINKEPKFENSKIRQELGFEVVVDTVTHTPPSTNILLNGDFEKTISSTVILPADWEVTQALNQPTSVNVGQNGIGGSKCLKLGIAATVTNCSVSQKLDVEIGKTYTFYGAVYYSAAPTNGKYAIITISSTGDDEAEIERYEIPVVGTMGATVVATDKSIIRSFDFTPQFDSILLKIETNGIDKLIRLDNMMLGEKALNTALNKTQTDKEMLVHGNIITLGAMINPKTFLLYDIFGHTILENLSGKNTIELTSLPKGVYVIKANAVSGEMVTAKIIK